jgi:hypothetical protein
MLIPYNATIRLVRRAGNIDRYGQPVRNTVYSEVHCCLEESSALILDDNGETQRIDALVTLEPDIELRTEDLLVMEEPTIEEYRVFDARSDIDANGVVESRTARLVKVTQAA